eukprot:351345_1
MDSRRPYLPSSSTNAYIIQLTIDICHCISILYRIMVFIMDLDGDVGHLAARLDPLSMEHYSTNSSGKDRHQKYMDLSNETPDDFMYSVHRYTPNSLLEPPEIYLADCAQSKPIYIQRIRKYYTELLYIRHATNAMHCMIQPRKQIDINCYVEKNTLNNDARTCKVFPKLTLNRHHLNANSAC